MGRGSTKRAKQKAKAATKPCPGSSAAAASSSFRGKAKKAKPPSTAATRLAFESEDVIRLLLENSALAAVGALGSTSTYVRDVARAESLWMVSFTIAWRRRGGVAVVGVAVAVTARHTPAPPHP